MKKYGAINVDQKDIIRISSDFREYLLQYGAPNRLSQGGPPWRRICQKKGHRSENCVYLQKIMSKPATILCKFCQSVGHEEKDYKSYNFLQERTMGTYFMKGEDKLPTKKIPQQP